MKAWNLVAIMSLFISCWAEVKETGNSLTQTVEPCFKDGFYLKIGSGASFANHADINAPSSTWIPAVEGYNGSLGKAPIVLGGLGYDSSYVAAEITASYRPNYSYRKFQTQTQLDPFEVSTTRTRKFNLDVSSLLFSIYLNGRGFPYLHWCAGRGGLIYPIIAGGIGTSQMKIFNFRATGLPPVVGFSSFTSENQYGISYRFTYQVMGGFEYRYKNSFALSAGYRWFDVSRFRGPRYIRDSMGNAADVKGDTWKIKFNANEVFVEFKVFL